MAQPPADEVETATGVDRTWEQELEPTFDDTPQARSALGLLGHLLAGVLAVGALLAALLVVAAAVQWILT